MILEDYIEKIKKIDFKKINKPWLNKSIVNSEFLSDIYPDNKIEEWKNFNIKAIASKKLQVLENKNIFFKEDLNKNYEYLIPFKNGAFDESRLEKKLEKKINIFKANDFKKNNSNIYKKIHADFHKYTEQRLSGYTDKKTLKLLSLNALLNKGTVLEIPSNTVVEDPICLYNQVSSEKSLVNPYLLILVGENSRVEFLDITSYMKSQNWTNFFYEVYLERNANLKISNLSLNQSNNINTASYNFHLKKSSNLEFSLINKGFSKKDIRIFLDGEHSRANVKGMILSSQKETSDVFCKVSHNARHTDSNQEWRMISSGVSQTSLNGKIKIIKNSKKSSGSFLSKSLLLDSKAKSFSKPELEIFEDDVACSHGASFGEIEKEKIFYLQSRGFSKNDAVKMLVLAFINELKISNSDIEKDISLEIEKMFLKRDLK